MSKSTSIVNIFFAAKMFNKLKESKTIYHINYELIDIYLFFLTLIQWVPTSSQFKNINVSQPLQQIMEHKTINSISQLLAFYKQTKVGIFYIGPFYSLIGVNLNDYIPTYQMIVCCDPFHGSLPYVRVPQFLKDHTCAGYDCQNIVLSHPEVINYIRSKDENANIIVMIADAQTQRLCKENGFNYWVAPTEYHDLLSNKVKIIDILKKVEIPFIQNVCSKIQSYQHLREITKKFNTSKIVVQDQNGIGGYGTMFIFSEEDYNQFKSHLENGKDFKITAFRNLKPFEIGAVATSSGTFVGPLAAEMIGHTQLAPYPAGYCGNQIRNSYYEDPQIDAKVYHEITSITNKFGDYIYKEKLYKGYYGLDFAVDIDTNEVFFMEINARLTGPAAITFMLYQAQGHKLPIYLYHCAQYMGLKLNLDVKAINSEWTKPRHYQNEISLMVIRPKANENIAIPYHFPVGIWKIQNDKPYSLNKCTFRLDDLNQGQYLFVPTKGFAIGSIITKKRTQDINFKLLQESKQIIAKFKQLRIKGSA